MGMGRWGRLGAFILSGGCAVLLLASVLNGCRSISSKPAAATQDPVPAKSQSAVQPAAPTPPATAAPVATPAAQGHAPEEGAWSRYVNSKYGYRVQYPSGAKVDEANPAHVIISFDVAFDHGTGHDMLTFEIGVEPQPKNFNLKAWVEGKQDPADAQPVEASTIAGQPAYGVRELNGDATINHIYLAENGKIFDLSYADPKTMGELPEDVQRYYSQILHKIPESFSLDARAGNAPGS